MLGAANSRVGLLGTGLMGKLVREVASSSGVELPVLDAVLERIGMSRTATPMTISPRCTS
ncbi:MAG: hypothetical protein ACTHMY_25075 [Solirubrobacteraceae bacterium]